MQGKVRSQESIEWRMSNIQHFKGRAVLIIRNPFAALVSSWRHVMKDISIDPSHPDHYDYFQRSALSEVKVWKEIAIDWLLVGKEVMVVHYEDMVMDAREQLERVLNFKASEDRLKCVEMFSFSKYKRKSKYIKREWIRKHLFEAVEDAIREVNMILVVRGEENIVEYQFE